MAIVLDGTTGITTPSLDSAAVNAGNDVGQVATFAMSTAPAGWMKANGATVSRTTYAALFDAIGTTFGAGDGSTTFVLPDLRGEFVRGWDDGRGVDSGRAFGSAQAQAIQSHNHLIYNAAAAGSQYGSTARPDLPLGYNYNNYLTSGEASSGKSSSTGGTETRPRNVALLACIKY